MTHWLVYTPEYGTVVPILDYGEGPMEYGRDVVCVDAPNRRQAIVAGVRKLRAEHGNGWLADCDGSPFTGIKAERAECPHGVCGICGGECQKCAAEGDQHP